MPLESTAHGVDNLDVKPELFKKVTVISGQTVVRGEVMQKTGQFIAGTGTADAGNTGNATIAGEVANDTASGGSYIIEALTATTFKVIDPKGLSLDAIATAGVAYDDQIGFTITAGGTPMVAGDFFTLAVTEGEGKQTSFITGSEPDTIMSEDVDASAGDVVGWAYERAVVKATEIDFGTGTDAEVRGQLGAKSIFIVD